MNKYFFLTLVTSILTNSLLAQINESRNIVVPKKIERFIDGYIQAWSRGDVKYIMDKVYDVPFFIIDGDSTMVLNDSADVEKFLAGTFESLKSQGYGYSIRNRWEKFEKLPDKNIQITSNYTRYLTTNEIMGAKERRATYIIKKKGNGYRITQLIRN